MQTSSTKDCSKFKKTPKEIFRICGRALGALFWVVSVALAQPSKELIQEMQAMRALTVRMYEESLIRHVDETCQDPHPYHDTMERHAALFFSLALDFMDKIPLLQTLQLKTPQDKEFVKTLKAYESLQLFANLRGYLPTPDSCENGVSLPDAFDATQVTQNFLDTFNLFFAPVFKAHKEGSSLWDALSSQTLKVRKYNSSVGISKQLDSLSYGFDDDDLDRDDEEDTYSRFIKIFLGVDLQQKPAKLLDDYYQAWLKAAGGS
ncbi:hypothetical protein [Helicobacter felis]|uniref:hypothetical protein n=1 Tax=Helicobacter felis TaxID=214 RepID=UPI001315896C|nr:hypothetical protein [Helicobacter felis]